VRLIVAFDLTIATAPAPDYSWPTRLAVPTRFLIDVLADGQGSRARLDHPRPIPALVSKLSRAKSWSQSFHDAE
jgi:hypothetical protein